MELISIRRGSAQPFRLMPLPLALCVGTGFGTGAPLPEGSSGLTEKMRQRIPMGHCSLLAFTDRDLSFNNESVHRGGLAKHQRGLLCEKCT